MKITFLLHNAYAVGGTVRATLNLAGALAARHDVEVVSVLRTEERPLLAVNGKVRLIPLVDERPDAASYDGDHELMSRPSAVVPPTEVLAHRYTALTDERLSAFLDTTDADVVVATRPALVVALAGHGAVGSRRETPGASGASGASRATRGGPLLIGQEHLSYDNHVPGVREAQNAAIGRLDAFVTVSARDAADHRRHLPGVRTRVTDIANAAPRPKAEPSDLRAPLVVAAGRLFPVKRYDLLVEAFAKVVAERPEWRLRIYGKGPERANLRAAIDRLGLGDHVVLMGAHATLETEWAKASVAAVSSEWESFGMTILEAMHAGVPVVATDCPHGPGEILTDGTDGLLVTPNDPNALATGLLRLIDDPELRQRLGTAGRTTVQRYAPRAIAAEYERLIADLQEARTPATTKLRRRLRRTLKWLPSTARTETGSAEPATGKARTEAAEPTVKNSAPKPLRPKARCRVDGHGGVRVSVAASGVSGVDLTLVLRRRHSGDEVRLPLRQDTPGEAKSRWTATLSRDEPALAEGRWDVYAERAEDGARRRVRAELVEQRGLLTAEPPDRSPVAWWIPYPTKDGFLALRTFHRTAHAEVTALPVGDGSIAVRGELHGAVLGEGATLVGVARGGGVADFEAPAIRRSEEVRATGRPGFHAELTSLPVSAGPDKVIWDLFLRPSPDAELIRLGRLFDDIVDRKDTDKYPAVTLAAPGGGLPQARFFFTVTNDLAVALS